MVPSSQACRVWAAPTCQHPSWLIEAGSLVPVGRLPAGLVWQSRHVDLNLDLNLQGVFLFPRPTTSPGHDDLPMPSHLTRAL